VAEQLSSKYKVVLLDLPGFGSSTQSTEVFDIQKYSEFIDEFINKLSLNHIILIGHSFGGKLSIKITSENSKIDKLFLISPSGIENKSLIVLIKTIIFKVLKVLLFWIPEHYKEKYILIFGSRDYVNAGTMRKTLKKIVNEKVTQFAININTPTIIIWGEKDTELNIKNAKLLKSLITNSTLRILWGVDHSPNISATERLSELLLEYL
jgi:pimeloyl-ACP methyl ester carboxylesterase